MSRLAFYAPMKSPTHPVPSGDRELAAGVLAALKQNASGFAVDLASELRCHDGEGNTALQQQLLAQAQAEIARLLADPRSTQWRAWVSYHNYYKAPDLLGPAICRQLAIPYVLIEASRSTRRLKGRWADFAARAEAACDQAAIIFYLTDRDRVALELHRQPQQQLDWLPPFLNRSDLPALPVRPVVQADKSALLLAVGMHRKGDKLASYRLLAEMLPYLETPHWQLQIVGDGPARAQVESLFSAFAEQVSFLGQLERQALADVYASANLFVWPGVNEAFGMVYLEAQAAGLPVVAQDRPGVREVLASSRSLVPTGNVRALAQVIDSVLASPSLQTSMSAQGRRFVQQHHLLGSAAGLLSSRLEVLIQVGASR